MSPAEETLTVVAYVFYLLSLLGYWAWVFAQVSQRRGAVLAAPGGAPLALAGEGLTPGSGGASSRPDPVQAGAGSLAPPAWPWAGRMGVGGLALAWVALTAALVLRWQSADHPPYVSLYDITTMLVWGTTTIYLLLFELAMKTRAAGAFVVLIIALLHTYAVLLIPDAMKTTSPLVPALRDPLLLVHVSIAILAYSAFTVAAGAALLYLVQYYQLGPWTRALPAPAQAEEFIFRAVAIGFPLQSLLLITGAYWAQHAWAKAWSWDPKEIWALITWLTYAAFLHVRVQRGWRGSTMAWLALVGFAVVLITFVGVNWLAATFGLQSMHTYSGGDLPGMALFLLFLGVLVALVGGIMWKEGRRHRPMNATQIAQARAARAAPQAGLPASGVPEKEPARR
jgi:cytochrome c-type biogenesis protein CcsB